ncbi:MAG: AraC family transcriptional regulator [Muribaculaceae bacterium]|nr:AraC family transcriptional regulator [Muribaculaceae bacterium]
MAVLLLVPSMSGAEDVAALLQKFETATGQDRVAVANSLMATFAEAKLTDDVVVFNDTTPADTITQQVNYWAGEYYYATADYAASRAHAEQALPLCRATTVEADCLNLLALVCFRQADYNAAADYARQCYALDEKSGDPDLMSASLNTIAGIYLGANRPQEAEKYILKAIAQAQQADNSVRLAVLQGTASEVYHAMLDDEKSLRYAMLAHKTDSTGGRMDRAAVRLVQIASALIGLHRYSEAEATLGRAIPVLRESNDSHSLGIALNKLGKALLSQERDAEAVPVFREAAALFVRMGDVGNELHARRGLYESLWTINPDSAHIELNRFDLLKDSLYSHATAESLSRFNAEFDNEWLRQENARHHSLLNILFIGGGVLIAITGVLLWWYRRRSRMRVAALQAIVDAYQIERHTTADNVTENDKDSIVAADREFLDNVVAHVRDAMGKGDLLLETLASSLCITRGHLNRRIKEITGVTAQQFVLRIRLEQARAILHDEPSATVADVAFRCGFEDAAGFSRAFKRTFNQTPTQFRQQQI